MSEEIEKVNRITDKDFIENIKETEDSEDEGHGGIECDFSCDFATTLELAFGALTTMDGFDAALLGESFQKMKKNTIIRAFKIIHSTIKQIYEEEIDNDEDLNFIEGIDEIEVESEPT